MRQGGNLFTARDVRFSPAALATPDRRAFFDSLTGAFTINATNLPGLATLAGIPPESLARIPAAHRLALAGTVQGRSITFPAGSFDAAGGSVTLRAARVSLPGPGADWKRDTTFEGDLALDIPDLGSLATIFHLPPLRGALNGKARISGSASAPEGTIEATGRGSPSTAAGSATSFSRGPLSDSGW